MFFNVCICIYKFVQHKPASLAWRIRACQVQTRCDHTPMSARFCSPVSAACCVPVSTTASRQRLRSAPGHKLVIPSHRLTTYGRRAFSVAGPMFWNSLPRNLCDPSHTAAVFGRSLKHFFYQSTSVHGAPEAFVTMRYINWCFTYLLYLLIRASDANSTLTNSLCNCLKFNFGFCSGRVNFFSLKRNQHTTRTWSILQSAPG